MALIDKLKGAAGEIDINASLAALEAANKLEGELTAKQTKLRSTLEQKEAERDRASIDDEAKYAKLDAEAHRIEGELKKNLAAIREAGRRKSEVEHNLRSQRHDADIRLANQFAKDTSDALADITKGLTVAIKAWEKLHELRSKKLIWRPELAINAGGLLLRPDEIQDVVELEIARLSTPQLPLDPNAFPNFPGKGSLAVGNPKTIKPLAEVGKEAGAYLLRRVEKLARVREAQTELAKKPASAPVAQEPVATVPEASGARVTADQVMAGLGRRRMA